MSFDWFDVRTFLVTGIVLPALALIAARVKAHGKEWIIFLVDGFLYWLGRHLKHSMVATLSLKKYCRLLLADESLQYLPVPSLNNISLHVDSSYVPLTLERADGTSEYSHKDILLAGKRIRVVGEPGSGKSSLIKKILRDNCLEGLSKPNNTRLTIRVELKELKIPEELIQDDRDKLGQWFYEYLVGIVSNSNIYEIRSCFENYVSTSGILVLLDGLDEVSSLQYDTISSAINAYPISQPSQRLLSRRISPRFIFEAISVV
jgi:hypothetical protein